MKKLWIYAVFMSISVSLLISCKEPNQIQVRDLSQSELLKVKEGIFEFSSEAKFKETITYLKTLNDRGSLDKWESQWQGFRSMRTAYNQISEEDQRIIDRNSSAKGYERFLSIIGEGDDRQAIRNVMDDALATLTNEKGVVKVGGVYRFYRYDSILEFTDKQLIDSELLVEMQSPDVSKGIKLIPLQKTTKTHTISLDAVNDYAESQGPLNEYWHNSRKYRVVGIIWCDGPPSSYNEIGGITKHQKRVFGSIWYDDNVSTIRLKYDAVVYVGYNGGQNVAINYDFSPSNQGYYNYSQNVVLGGNNQNFSIVSFTGYHWASCADGNGRDVNTSW